MFTAPTATGHAVALLLAPWVVAPWVVAPWLAPLTVAAPLIAAAPPLCRGPFVQIHDASMPQRVQGVFGVFGGG